MNLSLLGKAALRYSKMGWHVFPCKPGEKLPATPNGFKDATTEESKIVEWWTLNPNFNVAISCGPSGLAVVDLDVKGGVNGIENWHSWCAKSGCNPGFTTRAFTPSGGQHLLYRGVVKLSASVIAPGVDTRGTGGYILAAPSVIGDKFYAWDTNSPKKQALLPQQITDALAQKRQGKVLPMSGVVGGTLYDLISADGFTLAFRSGQYEGPCPWCQGKDRFFVAWPEEGRDGRGRYLCRQCGAEGDSIEWLIKWRGMKVDEAKKLRGVRVEPDPLARAWERLKQKPTPTRERVRCADCKRVHYRDRLENGKWCEWLECDHGRTVTVAMLETRDVECHEFQQREAAQ